MSGPAAAKVATTSSARARRCGWPAVEREVVPRPVDEHVGPVAEADEVHEVQAEPRHPADEPGEAQAVRELGDRVVAADRRHRPLVVVVERLGRQALEAPGDLATDVPAALDRRLGDLRQQPARPAVVGADVRLAAMSPIANTSGWPGTDRSLSTTMRPPLVSSTPSVSASGLARTPAAHTTTPAGSTLPSARCTTGGRSVGHDPVDADAEPHLDAARASACAGPARRSCALIAPSSRGAASTRTHADGAHVERREVLRQHLGEQLHHRPGGLDAGRSTAADARRSSSPRSIIAGSPRPPRTARAR